MDFAPQAEQVTKKAGWQILLVSFLLFISGLLILIGLFLGGEKTGITPSQWFFYYLLFIAIASITASATLPHLKKWAFWLTLIILMESATRIIVLNYPNWNTMIVNLTISVVIFAMVFTKRELFLR